jgi:hypothetical protein
MYLHQFLTKQSLKTDGPSAVPLVHQELEQGTGLRISPQADQL